MPLIISVLKGDASFSGMFGDESIKNPERVEATKVLSNKAGVVYSVGYYTDLSRIPSGAIGMVNITGPVTKYGDMCAWGSVDHVATISRLANAPNIKGIIINLDSPGGEAAGTAMLADAIKAASTAKPVIAVIDDGIAASAGMWIASAAQEIYTTQKTDMVGSVGVYTTIADWYGYFEKEGLNVRDIYAPQSTDKNLDYKEALQGNDELVKEDLKVLAQEFIDTVRRNRAGKINGDSWTTGKMFYSKDAIKIGLIDGQKSFDQVVRRMDTLIKSKEQSNNNTMAFEKTLVAAKSESFEVADGGFLLEEAQLNNIEAAFAANEANVTELTGKVTTAETAQKTAETNLATATQTITDRDATIVAKDEEIAKLKAGPAGNMKDTSKDKDDLGDTATVDPITAEANKLRAIRDGK
jgi:ClpP class serine protease